MRVRGISLGTGECQYKISISRQNARTTLKAQVMTGCITFLPKWKVSNFSLLTPGRLGLSGCCFKHQIDRLRV